MLRTFSICNAAIIKLDYSRIGRGRLARDWRMNSSCILLRAGCLRVLLRFVIRDTVDTAKDEKLAKSLNMNVFQCTME